LGGEEEDPTFQSSLLHFAEMRECGFGLYPYILGQVYELFNIPCLKLHWRMFFVGNYDVTLTLIPDKGVNIRLHFKRK
jgi:hypothetical protein